MVGYVRRNFLVPVPRMESFEALNAHLEERCLERMDARLRGHDETIGQRMERDLDARLPLPAVPYDACDQQASRVSSRSLVRYKTNDYSAPVAYGHRDVLVKGYVNEMVISCGAEVIARHPRSYEKDDFVFDPIHYLPLLERKTAAPSVGPIAVTPNGLEPARPMVATAQRLAAGGGRCRTWAGGPAPRSALDPFSAPLAGPGGPGPECPPAVADSPTDFPVSYNSPPTPTWAAIPGPTETQVSFFVAGDPTGQSYDTSVSEVSAPD